jgi:hypothetical protein
LFSLPASRSWAQEELPRKVKSRVAPVYPSLARQMNIAGVVKVQVTVAPNGTVKATKLVGGHPLLGLGEPGPGELPVLQQQLHAMEIL